MNITDRPIQSTKVTRPRITSSETYRSSSASNEYFTDYASDVSSGRDLGYETPLSRMSGSQSSGRRQRQLQQSEMTLPTRPAATMPAPLSIRQTQQERPARRLSSFDRFSPPTPGVDDTPYIRFALEQLTFDEELMGHGRHGSLQSTDDDYTTLRVIDDRGLGYTDQSAMLPQPTKQSFRFPRESVQNSPPHPTDTTFMPVEIPYGKHQLGYVPLPLRLPFLVLLILLCLLMIAGLIFSNVYASQHHGLYDYDGNATPRYFIFEYLPQLLGMIIIFWLFVVQSAMYRVTAYFSLSKEMLGRSQDSILQNMPTLPANFVLPDMRFFKHGEPLVGIALVVFWIMNFTIPLLGCLYQTQWVTSDGPPHWRWTTVQGLGWFLMALYIFLIGALICCIIRFRPQKSRLMWDPVSIADLLVLFQKSNILTDYERSEVGEDIRDCVQPRFCRLGYWNTIQSNEIFYTIGQANRPNDRLSLPMNGTLNEKGGSLRSSGNDDVERQRYSHASSFTRNIHSPWVRFRWCSWFVRDKVVLAWMISALLLLIAFLVVSFVNRAVQRGFFPLLPATTQSNGFSPANFLYSFLPGLIGMFLFLAWQPIDTFFRAIQPYANLSNPAGTTADRSLLQSYNSKLPGLVTLHAARHGDLKVAFVSFISLMAATIPILAGGVFTAQYFVAVDEVRMVASMPGYIALCVFLAIYALSYLVIWPTRKRYLPHSITTIGGQLSFLYASPLMNDSATRNVGSKSDLISRLVTGNKGLVLTGDGRATRSRNQPGQSGDVRSRRGEKYGGMTKDARYAFGIYIGRDGKEHLGIDRLQRPGSGEMLIVTGMPGRRSK